MYASPHTPVAARHAASTDAASHYAHAPMPRVSLHRVFELIACVALNCFAGLFAGFAVSHIGHVPLWFTIVSLYAALSLTMYSCVRAIFYYPER